MKRRSKATLISALVCLLLVTAGGQLIPEQDPLFVKEGDHSFGREWNIHFISDRRSVFRLRPDHTWMMGRPDSARLFPVHVNQLGVRVRKPGEALKPGRRTVLALGDSQLFGQALNYGQSLPAQLESILGKDWQVINAGVPAYGVPHQLECLRRIWNRIPKPEFVIATLWPTNDFQEALQFKYSRMRKMSRMQFVLFRIRIVERCCRLYRPSRPVRRTPDGYDLAPDAHWPWNHAMLYHHNAGLGKPDMPTALEEAAATTATALRALHDESRRSKARLIIVHLPGMFETIHPDFCWPPFPMSEEFREKLARVGRDVENLSYPVKPNIPAKLYDINTIDTWLENLDLDATVVSLLEPARRTAAARGIWSIFQHPVDWHFTAEFHAAAAHEIANTLKP